MKLLGLDIGTTTISAVVVENGRSLGRITYKNDSFIPAENSWERMQSPKYIRETALEAIKTLVKKHPDIERIGVTGQMHGIVYLDQEGTAISPLYTWQDERFSYRKESIATSIHPSVAALIVELAKPYLKEDAQIIDPFCGVGTMLIERNKKVPAREMYGIDIFGDAITFARENTKLAGMRINYIHRDFRDFKHEYLFNEIITNMPIRGKKTKQEMDLFYEEFFQKAKTILTSDAVVVMYTNEIGFVKKQLRLHKEFTLLQETCLQPKNDFNLLIMGYKG